MTQSDSQQAILLDWGGTLMPDLGYKGPMAGWPKVSLMDGAKEMLKSLTSEYQICVATNAKDSEESDIWQALKRVSIDRFIDHIFCYRSVGVEKSDPGFFGRILIDLDIRPEQVVMVGDDWEEDILAARKVGIRAVWYHPIPMGRQEEDGIRFLKDLRQLKLLLQTATWGVDGH